MNKFKTARNQRNKFSLLISLTILILVVIGCETGPPKISKVIVSNQKDSKENNLTFKPEDTIYVAIEVENILDGMKFKSNMTLEEDIFDLKKGDVLPGTDGNDDIASNVHTRLIEFSYPDDLPDGKYKVNIELQDKDGEKVDSKSVEIKVEGDDKSDNKSNYSPPIID